MFVSRFGWKRWTVLCLAIMIDQRLRVAQLVSPRQPRTSNERDAFTQTTNDKPGLGKHRTQFVGEKVSQKLERTTYKRDQLEA